MLHKVSGSYSLKFLFLASKKNLASKLSNSEEGIVAASLNSPTDLKKSVTIFISLLVFWPWQVYIFVQINVNITVIQRFQWHGTICVAGTRLLCFLYITFMITYNDPTSVLFYSLHWRSLTNFQPRLFFSLFCQIKIYM